MTGIPSPGADDAESRLDIAVDWLLRMNARREGDEALEEEFISWLEADPQNHRDWEKACRSWQLMGETVPETRALWPVPGAATPGTTVIRFAPRRRRIFAGAFALAAAAVVAAIALPGLMLRFEADHYTGTAELQTLRLEDGSEITLGARSAIATDLSGGTRRVRLLSGEAWFEVAHDAERPFIVSAGDIDATVLGTAFSVRFGEAETEVALAEGALKLSLDGEPVLAPGDSVTIEHQTGAVLREALATDDMGAWREGRIFVNDQRLASVAEQISRYHPGWVKIADASLGEQRVTGLYDLSDPDRALRALVQPWGGTVREISPWMVVLSRW